MKTFLSITVLLLLSCSSEPQEQNNDASRTILIQRKEKMEAHIKEMKARNPKAVIPPFYIRELKNLDTEIKKLE